MAIPTNSQQQWATWSLALATWLLISTTVALSPPPQPADHLIPPPAPTAATVVAPHHAALPVAQRLTHAGYSEPAQETGFMTRVARWFGLGGAATAPRDQQLSAAGSLSYAYPKPAQHFDAAGKPCGQCNKYPWVPMMGQQQPQPQQQQQQQQQHQQPQQQSLHIQQQQLQHLPQQTQQVLQQQLPHQQLISAWQQQQQQQQQPLAQASQHRQRAVQFHAPSSSVFLPIAVPVPALSQVALPPLYNAQQFRPLQHQQQQQQQHLLHPLQQQLPLENVGAHSELRPVPVPTASPPAQQQTSSNFEIVQSHQVTDFVTSVEYPATFVQSHSIDLGQTGATLPSNHKQPEEQQHQQQEQDISTVRYQLEDLSSGAVHQHLPASQLLTELGHFEPQTTLPPPADNYPAASSQQQLQHEQEQETDQEQQQLYFAEQYQELAETSTVTPQYESLLYSETTTEQPTPAAIELNHNLVLSPSPSRDRDARQRETPKRLLDSPINHMTPHGGAAGVAPPPRPFTRDPSELNFRLGHSQPTHAPTPTSTYGAIDASGQFAGMSPPPPGPQQVIIPYTTKQKPRPFEPSQWTPGWNVRHPQQQQQQQLQDNDVELHEQQESKLVSTATAAPPPNTRRTTKYLTKILATNLRELLKRERETKRRPAPLIGVDISKLQHNIDGWTEQEYNSLSHRPSTPTIRGRSKHIPSEYLTTTTTPATPIPSPTQTLTSTSKITRGGFELGGSVSASQANGGDLSTSINNLEQLQLKRFPPVDDNRLLDFYEPQQQQQHRHSYATQPITSTTSLPPTTTTTTTARTTTTATAKELITPLYVRSTPAPMELWKQAKVAILPQTNEKVYVVTPQPRHQHQHQPQPQSQSHQSEHSEPTAAASVQSPVYQTPAPRFPRIRPTPGTATAVEATPATEQLRNYTPDIFGLRGLSAYVPAEPVEIIDGNSKVITIVTAAPTAAALQRPTAKSTISPSPR
ncbi:proteoglycan 4 [Drosophila nasuta]|uniref:proteoglycan 4 n=1 Tax=Drosophila nasuta TaxID=42062 RepID=UPI00295F1D61|nr:proteoglycan 4 [Drosophila nasuta]